jgi:transcriptional regulator NrdR family protein
MKKIEKCPKCGEVEPALTLSNETPDSDSIPENRVYGIVCLACGKRIETITVDNTLKAVKALRDEMDELYGKATVIPIELLMEDKK